MPKFNRQNRKRQDPRWFLTEGTNLPMSYQEVGTDYDPETGAEITKFDEPMVVKGRNPRVVELQNMLVKKGLLKPDQVDGIIGPITTKAFNDLTKRDISTRMLKRLVQKSPLLTTLAGELESDTPEDRKRAMAGLAGLSKSIPQ